jgi:histidinol-phosphatase (PHP family)
MIPQDYHMHSNFSEDGTSSPEEMCRQAIALGIPEVGFAEHWDIGPFEKNPRFFKYDAWYEELDRLRKVFHGQLIIRAGIEIAEPHLYPQESAEVLKQIPFDYVIGSVHFVGPNFMFDDEYFKKHTADEVYPAYFAEVETMLETADMDILAHLDVPMRTAKPIIGYEPARYRKQIEAVLRKAIERGIALDVNAAGLRKSVKSLMPDPVILQWYAALGGRYLTLGSDAHAADQVGLHLEKALQAIRAAGIKELTRFESRKKSTSPI